MTNHPNRSRRSNPAANAAQPRHDTPLGRWRARMGLTQRAAAEALRMPLVRYQRHERQMQREDAVVLLAAAAVEQRLPPVD